MSGSAVRKRHCVQVYQHILYMMTTVRVVGKVEVRCECACSWQSWANPLMTHAGGGTAGPSGEEVGNAVINALVIVGVITLATFVLVFCYYMRWLKLMVGYLMLSSTMLLGYSGGFVVWTFFQVFHVSISWVTFGLIMWNFAIVGVVSVRGPLLLPCPPAGLPHSELLVCADFLPKRHPALGHPGLPRVRVCHHVVDRHEVARVVLVGAACGSCPV